MPTTKAKSAKPASNSEYLRHHRPRVREQGLKIAATAQDVAAAKNAPTPEDKPVDNARYEAILRFDHAHAHWLRACAVIQDPPGEERDEATVEYYEAERQAKRELFLIPSVSSVQLWTKIEVFEQALHYELSVGSYGLFDLQLALAGIKSDIRNLCD
jgi:hypothetical protein